MNLSNPVVILAVVAVVMAVVGMIRPSWPVTQIAVLLLAVAILIKG